MPLLGTRGAASAKAFGFTSLQAGSPYFALYFPTSVPRLMAVDNDSNIYVALSAGDGTVGSYLLKLTPTGIITGQIRLATNLGSVAATYDFSLNNSTKEILWGGVQQQAYINSNFSVVWSAAKSTSSYYSSGMACKFLWYGTLNPNGIFYRQNYSAVVPDGTTSYPPMLAVNLTGTNKDTFSDQKVISTSSNFTSVNGSQAGMATANDLVYFNVLNNWVAASSKNQEIIITDATFTRSGNCLRRTSPSSYDDSQAVAVDSSGNIYATWYVAGGLGIAKWNSSRVSQWAFTYATPSGIGATAQRDMVYANGYLLISFEAPSGTNGCCILAINPSNGDVSYLQSIDFGALGARQTPNGLKVNETLNLYTVCSTRVALSLKPNGSITGTFSLSGNNITIANLTNPTKTSVSNPFSTSSPLPTADNTSASATLSTSTPSITSPTYLRLA